MGDFRRPEDVLEKLFVLYERPMYYYALEVRYKWTKIRN